MTKKISFIKNVAASIKRPLNRKLVKRVIFNRLAIQHYSTAIV